MIAIEVTDEKKRLALELVHNKLNTISSILNDLLQKNFDQNLAQAAEEICIVGILLHKIHPKQTDKD